MTLRSPTAGVPKRGAIMTVLGLTQIMAWGSSYYLPAVIAPPGGGRHRLAAGLGGGWPFAGASGRRLDLASRGVVN
ncbi:hypothetical protein [Mesorhizobium silamurunense]|uniref:hypothetical protein n=1 Tax=Mesorhizobium silamurunense TaxID=499528 RepID=UPI0031BB5D95